MLDSLRHTAKKISTYLLIKGSMKNHDWFFYVVVGGLVLVYFIGEVSGYLFFAMLIILPVWVWLLTGSTKND